MPWIKLSHISKSQVTKWDDHIRTVKNCSPAQAQRIALKDPKIKFFTYCREKTLFENPQRIVDVGDVLFFSKEPSFGSSLKFDTYQKTGMSVAYVCQDRTLDMAQNMQNTGCYTLNGSTPAIDIVCIFAANINQKLQGNAQLLAPGISPAVGGSLACGNPDIVNVLKSEVISSLQKLGITVLLTFLNNNDNAGWSEFSSTDDASCFTNQLQYIVNQYGLDGIDIDDEYSKGTPNSNSLAMVTYYMKQAMPKKIISKALYSDSDYFSASFNGTILGQNLTYGWEMSYGTSTPSGRLSPYLNYGLSSEQLFLGFWAGSPSQNPSQDIQYLQSNNYGGMMVYNFNNSNNSNLMGELVNYWYGSGSWNIKPNCLSPSISSSILRSDEKQSYKKGPLPFQPKRGFCTAYQQVGLMHTPTLRPHIKKSLEYSPRFITTNKSTGSMKPIGKILQKAAPLLRNFVR
jgi:hypothetical protein